MAKKKTSKKTTKAPSIVLFTNAPENLDYYPSAATKIEGIRKVTISERGADTARLADLAKYQRDRYEAGLFKVWEEQEFTAIE